MFNRRLFLESAAMATVGGVAYAESSASGSSGSRPVVISTWNHGLAANEAAWKVLSAGGRALDAVESGVRVSESDPNVMSVGFGGRPDRAGNVTLDACIMDETGNCGSVAFLQNIENPISVARLVMEQTPHVMLVGEGAQQFALANGFTEKELLTPAAKKEWELWKADHPDAVGEREVNVENHDTIGLVAIDSKGDLSGACTTSGLAWKLPGRVGDSPIIGAGLYVDNEVGAATATGVGEAVIKAVGTFLVVELMRQGHSPQKACELAVERVVAKNPDWNEIQVGFIALNKQGQTGAYAIQPGFEYAAYDSKQGNRLNKTKSHVSA